MNDRTVAAPCLAKRVQALIVALALATGVAPASLAQTRTPAASPSAVVSTAYVRGVNGRIERISQKLANGSTREMIPLHGHNNTVIGTVDGDGNVIEENNYSAFGLPEPQAGSQQKHGFQGEYWDEDAQLLYLRGRWYDPRIGRLISADPSEGRQHDPRSLNRYAFAHNNPVHNRDPSGRMSVGELSAAATIGGILNVAVSYQPGQGLDAMATNLVVGAAEGVVLGGVFSGASNFLKAGKFLSYPSSLENVAILKRVGLSGKLFPGRAVLSEQMTFKVGSETVLLQSNALKVGGAGKHLHEVLGKAPTAGQTTLAEVLVLQEAEAAIHMAIKE